MVAIRQADRLAAEVLVGRIPGDGEFAFFRAGADEGVAQLHHRLGEIDLDPELRPVAGLRRAIAQADAAFRHERDAVNAFVIDLEGEFLRLLGIERVFHFERKFGQLVPRPAFVERVPQFDRGDAGGADVFEVVAEGDLLGADELAIEIAEGIELSAAEGLLDRKSVV